MLIVDDDEDHRALMQLTLRRSKEKFEVFEAATFGEGPCDGQRGVAGERAYLNGEEGPEGAYEQREERTLVGGNLHEGQRPKGCCGLDERRLDVVGCRAV